jgi:beta-fructofuranosidase
MLTLGSGVRDKGGMVLLYTSPDLLRWTYLHPLLEGTSSNTKTANPVDTGDMWECPDFFPLGDKHVLLISTMGKVHWKIGTYAKQHFEAGKPDLIAAGWAGAMSLPRTLSLSSQGELKTEVAPIVRKLRSAHISINPDQDPATRQKILDSLRMRDLAAELELHFYSKSDDFTLRLQFENGVDFAAISCINRSGSRQLQVNKVTAPLPGAAGSPVHLHMFLDGSALEVFANGTTALTERIYQAPPALCV